MMIVFESIFAVRSGTLFLRLSKFERSTSERTKREKENKPQKCNPKTKKVKKPARTPPTSKGIISPTNDASLPRLRTSESINPLIAWFWTLRTTLGPKPADAGHLHPSEALKAESS